VDGPTAPNQFAKALSGSGGPPVSVIVPTRRGGLLLRRCLESLQAQSFPAFETILVSDGAGEGVARLAEEYGCRLAALPESRGFAAAVNAGIALAQAPYVVLLNDDAELHSDWLGRTSAMLDSRPEVSFCCGKIYQSDGLLLDNAGDALAAGGAAWRLGFGRRDAGAFDRPRALLAASCTATMFRREVFAQVGTLDEDFISYLEDIDLALRCAREGLQGYYLPQAVSRHHGGATLGGGTSREVFRLLTRNQLLLLAKHYPLPLLLRLAPRILWSQTLWAALAVRKNRVGAYLSGIAGFLRALGGTLRNRRACSPAEQARLLALLRQSEAEIYADVSAPDRARRDAFWTLYFLFSRPPKRLPPAAEPDIGRLPIP